MIYMLFATQQPPPGQIERIVFIHPGSQQEVMQFAAQLVGAKPVVPYQISNLLNQPRTSQPLIYCRQFTQSAQSPLAGLGGMDSGPNIGPRDVPSDLHGVRPDQQNTSHAVTPSGLGDKYSTLPADLLGEF